MKMTTIYNYLEAITNDVKEYIENKINLNDYEDKEALSEHLNDTLWATDSITGNASGSYYCNSYKAEEAICHNWDLLQEALEEFDNADINILEKGAEWCDVTIRCYLLGQAIKAALDELNMVN